MGFVNYFRAGHLSAPFSLPLIIGGVIGAGVGACVPIDTTTYTWLLSVVMILVAAKMTLRTSKTNQRQPLRKPRWGILLCVGLIVGIVSGVVGIGGGIILGPLVLIFRQAAIKTSAAMTSLLVATSSAAALMAHTATTPIVNWPDLLVFGLVCLLGGYLGSRFGANRASPRMLEIMFGILVFVAGLRLMISQL